jgi:hypothetical protein
MTTTNKEIDTLGKLLHAAKALYPDRVPYLQVKLTSKTRALAAAWIVTIRDDASSQVEIVSKGGATLEEALGEVVKHLRELAATREKQASDQRERAHAEQVKVAALLGGL